MNGLSDLKKKVKIKLSRLVKPEWRYIELLDEIIKSNPGEIVGNRFLIYDFLIARELKNEKILYFEFGVFKGETIRYWLDHYLNPESEFYGFDTFTGLPEDWNARKKGSYSADGKIPKLNDDRVNFMKGLFQETLPGFLEKQKQFSGRKVIHLDADLYSSTLFALSAFMPYLKKDDILIFDEFGFELNHEFRAFVDFFDMSKIKYEMICSTAYCRETAIKIL